MTPRQTVSLIRFRQQARLVLIFPLFFMCPSSSTDALSPSSQPDNDVILSSVPSQLTGHLTTAASVKTYLAGDSDRNPPLGVESRDSEDAVAHSVTTEAVAVQKAMTDVEGKAVEEKGAEEKEETSLKEKKEAATVGREAEEEVNTSRAASKTVTVTEPTTEKLTTMATPPESPMSATSNASPSTCQCSNIAFGNLSITVTDSKLLAFGSVPELDLTQVTALCPEATYVTIRADLTEVTGHSAGLAHITELDLSGNHLNSMPKMVLEMTALRRLGLAGNNITKLPQEMLESLFRRLDEVDIRDNPLQCSPDLTWLYDVTAVGHWDTLTCLGVKRDPFGIQYDRKPLRMVIDEIRRVDATCPAGCRCRLKSVHPTQVWVDCGGMGLERLPSSLPRGVIALNVSGNRISSAPLCQLLSSHRSLSTILLSHNQLSSVEPADLACAADRLGRLDLRYNRLTRLPWEELVEALRGERMNYVYLSHNRWNCEYEEEAMKLWVSFRRKSDRYITVMTFFCDIPKVQRNIDSYI
ncbi:Leucine-rich repeat-containing protein 3 [Amphibalanus amphitrite]|uniref:Leucine-rich repeat-containing protein 3 n=1 Tax=Amphibalanus amphitrite TaxID=1232801 RepID=A0A6A4VDH4_AMPAM|nr:Leucine-rich repeat-containing protein 3 [Amphibalanus amphitrite]